jgi:glycosyltransferase involved in cell wall biosynthesis
MRFSVDAHAIGRNLTGNEAYVRNLLRAFAAVDDSNDFIAYLSVEGAQRWVPERFQHRRVSDNPFVRLGIDLSHRLRKDGSDLLHVQYTAPLGCPVPVVASVHDISFLERPDFFTRARALQLRITVSRTVLNAAKILTLSNFSKDAILNAYNLTEDKVISVPAAHSPMFRPISRDASQAYLARRYRIPSPFILTVGDLQPRKNQIGLIRAFERLAAQEPALTHSLVLVGKDTWFSPRIREVAARSPLSERILFTGYVGETDLLHFYNGCDLFVFPSIYEGFGIPILEAMACGRAVACSNTSAMQEVADAAAILFNPNEVEQITRSMRDLLTDPELRARMERLALQNAARFCWERTARETLNVYYQIVGGGIPESTGVKPAARA